MLYGNSGCSHTRALRDRLARENTHHRVVVVYCADEPGACARATIWRTPTLAGASGRIVVGEWHASTPTHTILASLRC